MKKPRAKSSKPVRRRDRSSIDAATELAAARSNLAAAKRELGTLYAALDNVESGLLVLDGNLRAVYSNPALHRIFQSFSAEQIRKTHPLYEDLLRAAVAALSVDIQDYVARRLAWVRSEHAAPMDLHMTNGTVVRSHVTALPDGGRMLVFSDVTDIVRNAEEMERLATVDGMTGIYNRRHFLALADREWNRARRYGRPISFLMIDIDHFKAINDDFGHEAGDRMIVHLANIARDCKRDSDVLARIGGEEFAILLPETTLEQATAVAERLRRHVAGSALPEVARSLSVSIGVATADEGLGALADLMKSADRALYCAKRSGRNQVVCSAPANAARDVQDAPALAPVGSASGAIESESAKVR